MSSELLSSASAVAGVVGLAVSIAACLVAWRSAVYSRRGAVAAERSAEAAVRSAEAAGRSAELQTAALHRDIEAAQRANIVLGVTWAGPGSPTLHVRNDGPSPAYNLDFIIRPVKPQKKSPKISSSEELPLKELPPDGYMKFYTEKWSFWNPLCDVTATFSDGNGPQQRTERLGS
jgi:hypothetical protein